MPKANAARILAIAACIAAVSAIAAEPSAEDAQKYRVSVMTALKGHIGAASMIVRGIVADDGHLLGHAEGIARGVAELHRVFQPGSDVNDSEALPVIWEQPDKFAAALGNAERASSVFRDVVASNSDASAIGTAFRDLGLSCRACHDDFRVAH